MNQVIEHTIAKVIAFDDAQRRYEARKLTPPDGWIWPVKRAAMRHGPTLRDRMVEDLRQAALTTGATAAALFSAGWTLNQIETHAEGALDAVFPTT